MEYKGDSRYMGDFILHKGAYIYLKVINLLSRFAITPKNAEFKRLVETLNLFWMLNIIKRPYNINMV